MSANTLDPRAHRRYPAGRESVVLHTRNPQIPLRRAILFGGDVVCLVASLVTAAFIRLKPAGVWVTPYLRDHAWSMAGIVVNFLLVFYAVGMYERQALTRRRESTLLPLTATLLGLVVNMAMFYARFRMDVGRGILLLACLFIFLSTAALRHLYRVGVGHGFLNRRVLVIGERTGVRRILHLIRVTRDSGMKPFGVVYGRDPIDEPILDGTPVLGGLDHLREYVDAYDIDTLVVTTAIARDPAQLRTLRPLRHAGVRILDTAALVEDVAQQIPLDDIDDEWLMHAAMNSSVLHIRKLKRLLDVAVAGVGLCVSVPVWLAAAVLIKLGSPGPVLYRQRRVMKDGETYTLLKFRTMREDAEAITGAAWSRRDDERVTWIGRWLRRWRIDEIPQLINVLKGEMSLVGPRPERPEFVEVLRERIPYYDERLVAAPGLTGWAQVNFGYGASTDDARQKLQYDLYYIKHMGLRMDVQILLRTVWIVLRGAAFPAPAGEGDGAGGERGLRLCARTDAENDTETDGQEQSA